MNMPLSQTCRSYSFEDVFKLTLLYKMALMVLQLPIHFLQEGRSTMVLLWTGTVQTAQKRRLTELFQLQVRMEYMRLQPNFPHVPYSRLYLNAVTLSSK
jgi:hypothetical protein